MISGYGIEFTAEAQRSRRRRGG